ncbi:4-galactosyl-N-acetylglucosaminide 3-alpha-L-fucosyltransferase FUT6-like isoform X2 [Lineus longissimus]
MMSWPTCKKKKWVRVFFLGSTGLLFVVGMIVSQQQTYPTAVQIPQGKHFTVAYGTPYFFQPWIRQYVKSDAYAQCAFNNCIPIRDTSKADAVVFHHWDLYPSILFTGGGKNRRKQVWIYYGKEPVSRTNWFSHRLNGIFNWTATYLSTSDIHLPYGTYAKIPSTAMKLRKSLTELRKKTKTAFILMSHCHTWSRREDLVEDLRKHIDVDVLGKCGKPCPNNDNCDFNLFEKEYKFYLAFENSKCFEYITEKLWNNALAVGLVPVVLGGHSRNDYEALLPPESFIYADDFSSPKQLAEYLKKVGSDSELYNKFLRWREHFRVSTSQEKIDVMCGVCRGLNNKTMMSTPQIHNDMDKFWSVRRDCHGVGPGVQNGWFENAKAFFLYVFGIL